jgi:hypothetical protein
MERAEHVSALVAVLQPTRNDQVQSRTAHNAQLPEFGNCAGETPTAA